MEETLDEFEKFVRSVEKCRKNNFERIYGIGIFQFE
jgi:hypothetical protein